MGISLRILAVLTVPLLAVPALPCLCFLHEAAAETASSSCCEGGSQAPPEPAGNSCEGCVCVAPREDQAPLATTALFQATPTACGVHASAAQPLGILDSPVQRLLRPPVHAPPPPPRAACVLLCVRLT